MDPIRAQFVLALVDLALFIVKTEQPTYIAPETRVTLFGQLNDLLRQMERDKSAGLAPQCTPSLTVSSTGPAQLAPRPRHVVQATGYQTVSHQATTRDNLAFPPQTVNHRGGLNPAVQPRVAPLVAGPSADAHPGSYNPQLLQGNYRSPLPQGSSQHHPVRLTQALPRPTPVGPAVGKFEYTRLAGYPPPIVTGYPGAAEHEGGGMDLQSSYQNPAVQAHHPEQGGYQPVPSTVVPHLVPSSVPVHGSRYPLNPSQYPNLPGPSGPRGATNGRARTKRNRSPRVTPYTSGPQLRCTLENCDNPNYEFASIHELRRHQETTKAHCTSPEVCQICGVEIGRTDSLKRHVELIHPDLFDFFYTRHRR